MMVQGLIPLDEKTWSISLWAPDAEQVSLVIAPAVDGERQDIPLSRPISQEYWQATFNTDLTSFDYSLSVDHHHGLVDPFAKQFSVDDNGFLTSVATRTLSALPPPRLRPEIATAQSVIYECHVKGYSMLRDDVGPADRGTFRAWHDGKLAREIADMGFTAIEFLPIHAFENEPHLAPLGLSNYWGYNSLGFFAPHPSYGTTQDFQMLVHACHRQGIEVILDVVYNHTAESDHAGPVRAFKAFANQRYYRIDPHQPDRYQNPTGTGNSLNTAEPVVAAMVLDSLVYWHQEMGVDGFRFDLAPTLARGTDGAMGGCDLLTRIAQHPALGGAKLIAEPWDIGDHGYQLNGAIFQTQSNQSNKSNGWTQWNDQFRDSARRLVASPGGALQDFAQHLVGATNHVGFISAHDGFTLEDLVSFEQKHNHANGEQNRDGHGHNLSHNHGVEGPSDDPAIVARRVRAKRFFLSLLAVSRPIPMVSMGDELGRTQTGNNNAYCQDNQISWMDWDLGTLGDKRDLRGFLRQWLTVRKQHLGAFIAGPIDPQSVRWLDNAGMEMTARKWEDPTLMAITMLFENSIAISVSLVDQALALPQGFNVIAVSDPEAKAPYVQLAAVGVGSA